MITICGIAGFYCFKKQRPTFDEIKELFVSLQERGTDASGFATFTGGRIDVFKQPQPAKEFINSKAFKRLKKHMPPILLMHTRAKTKGSEQVPANNHPIYLKERGLCMVHNGQIRNDDQVFKVAKFARQGQVDSEAIIRTFESEDGFEAGLLRAKNILAGTAAFALIDKKQPDKLLLARNMNPLSIFMDTKRDILFFASVQDYMDSIHEQSLRKDMWYGFNLYEEDYFKKRLREESAIIVGPKGVERKIEFKMPVSNPVELEFKEPKSSYSRYFNSGYGEWDNHNHHSNSWKHNRRQRYRPPKNEQPPSGYENLNKAWEKWRKLNSGVKENEICLNCGEQREIVKFYNFVGGWVCCTCFLDIIEAINNPKVEPAGTIATPVHQPLVTKPDAPVVSIKDRRVFMPCDRCQDYFNTTDLFPHEISLMEADKTRRTVIHKLCLKCQEDVFSHGCAMCGIYDKMAKGKVIALEDHFSICEDCQEEHGYRFRRY